MKKSSFLFILTIVMLSCGSTYKAKKVVLADFQDSINYVVGYYNGVTIRPQLFASDSGSSVINAFIDALTEGYTSPKKRSEMEEIGTNLGSALQKNEKTGLADNPKWGVNEDLFFKGFINGIVKDTKTVNYESAQQYMEYITRSEEEAKGDSLSKPLIKKAKCPTKKDVQQVSLTSRQDSINYIFGYLNGYQLALYVLADDSTSKKFDTLVHHLNESLHSSIKYSDQISLGKQIGNAIKNQEEIGLLGINGWETQFELIKQGFINGLYVYNEIIDEEEANQFISASIDKYKFGGVKQNNEKWLEENSHKEGVAVTPSGLQYQVIKIGKGKVPTATDKVRVHYHGTLTDGTVFDSSVDRGEPAEFPLNGVIRGWTEGLQLMPVGSKFKFFIKPELGYGANDMGSIPPYSILIFEVELLDIIDK